MSEAMNNTDSLCHKCGSMSGVYLQICDDCMTRFHQLDSVDRSKLIDSTKVSKARAKRCVTHSYACDCREYRYERMRDALIRIMVWAHEDVMSGETRAKAMADIAEACRDGLHE